MGNKNIAGISAEPSCYLAFAGKKAFSAGMLADSILNKKEKKFMNCVNKAKRTEWVLGRLAAKASVHDFLGNRVKCRDITIKPAINAAPLCYIKNKKSKIFISISHSAGYATAASSRFPVGIDVETARKLSRGLCWKVFNKDDCIENLKNGSNAHYTAMWCAKEAVAKALGLGTSMDFKSIRLKNKHGNSATAGCGSKKHRFSIEIKRIKNVIVAVASSNER